ncbi:MAG: hypothetical protein K5829_06175 [Treponema sp.]|nr:hypothetical protein [Treponema sp.]
MIDTVLCVDIGTTSLKAALITASGEVVSISSYKFLSPNNRYISTKWLMALKKAFDKLCSRFYGQIRILALGISGNGPTLVCGQGLTCLWNEKTGISKERSSTSLFLPNILFIKENYPKEFEESKYLFSGPEYLIYELTGNAVTILPEARFESAYWNKELLEKEGIPPSKMPAFFTIGQCFGRVTSAMIEELGLKDFVEDNLPVFGAGPDFVAALIGTGTLKAGRICDRSGSSEGLNFCIPAFVKAEGMRTLPSVIPGLWNISFLIPKSSKIPEDKRLQLLKDSLERLKKIALENRFDFPEKMLVTGGQTRNSSFMKKKAGFLGIKLHVCTCSDSELLGDACVAWYGLGKYKSLYEASEKIVKEGVIYENL